MDIIEQGKFYPPEQKLLESPPAQAEQPAIDQQTWLKNSRQVAAPSMLPAPSLRPTQAISVYGIGLSVYGHQRPT